MICAALMMPSSGFLTGFAFALESTLDEIVHFSPPGGFFFSPVTVTMSTPSSGVQIRYTTNGDRPTEQSSLYSGPVNVDKITHFKARAFDPDGNPLGPVAFQHYGFESMVVGWGGNNMGHIDIPPGLINAVAVSIGNSHSVALKADGTVEAWGLNHMDALAIPPGLTDVVEISAGWDFTLALKSDGTVVAWGANSHGQTNVPPDLEHVTAIAAGSSHSLALLANGEVVAWGDSDAVVTGVPSNIADVIAIEAGAHFSVALKQDGRLETWGYNLNGELNAPKGPVDVFVAISANNGHALALRPGGIVAGWGWNNNGQAAAPHTLTNVAQIAAGYWFSLALKRDGSIVGWGDNRFGQMDFPQGLTNIIQLDAHGFNSLALLQLPEATSAVNPHRERPDLIELEQNYPNPFNPSTSIRFSLPVPSDVRLEIYTIQGQRLAILADGPHQAGFHNVSYDASRLAGGVYLYKLTADGQTLTRKMNFMK